MHLHRNTVTGLNYLTGIYWRGVDGGAPLSLKGGGGGGGG